MPSDVLEEVARNLGDLDGKIVVDVSGGRKRVAADGYLEFVSDSTNSERIQSRHPTARVVRIGLADVFPFVDPLLVGTPPAVPIASNDPRAREAVARIIFDVGLDPWDAGPLRFSRVFDAWGLLSVVPAQQGRAEGYVLKFMPSVPWPCIFDPAEAFGFGRPYDLDHLPRFPRRDPRISCDEWRRRIGIGRAQAMNVRRCSRSGSTYRVLLHDGSVMILRCTAAGVVREGDCRGRRGTTDEPTILEAWSRS